MSYESILGRQQQLYEFERVALFKQHLVILSAVDALSQNLLSSPHNLTIFYEKENRYSIA